jgi:hypothetical protein
MKVIKCSDETYAFVCKVAADRKTYLADAVDFLVFKQSERISELESRIQELEVLVANIKSLAPEVLETAKLPRIKAQALPRVQGKIKSS